MSATRALRAHLLVLVLAALCLSGCGSDEPQADDPVASSGPESPSASTPTGPSAPPGTPDCDTVWQDGATLPKTYKGCVAESGEFVASDPLGCSSGQRIIRYDDRFYGVAGGTVHEATAPLDRDQDYRAVVLRCRA